MGAGTDDDVTTDESPGDEGRRLVGRMLEHHGVAALTVRDGRVEWANPVVLDLVRPPDCTDPDELLIPLLDRALRVPAGASVLAEGEERSIEIELATNRALLKLAALAVGGVDEQGPMVLVSFRAPLEASVDPAHFARLEAMVDATSDIVTVIDHDGRIRFSNPAANRLTGMAGAEANGVDMLSLVHPDDVAVVADAFNRGVLEDEDIAPIDVRIRMADGEWHHTEARLAGRIDVDGTEARVVGLRDITDRVRREAEGDAQRRLLESVVAYIEDIIVILTPDLSVRWASPGVETLVDAPAYTHIGEGPFGDMHPDDVDDAREALATAMEQPNGFARTRVRLHHARRGWRWTEATVLNLIDDPAVGGLVCTLRDITDQLHQSDELRRLRDHEHDEADRLRAADRLKDTFLATVSHELRTPLTSVRGFSTMLRDQWDSLDNVTRTELIERIASNAATMETMIEQMLDFSRLQAGRVEVTLGPIDVDPIVADMVDALSLQLAAHHVVVHPSGLRVVGDRRAMDNVLRNLLTNAARYSADGTTIDIGARRQGDRVRLHVRDEGIGIAPEDHSRVFQSFFQSSPAATARRGAGVGLNVARRYAQLQNGQLSLVSAPGEGSTFTLVIPESG